MIVIGMSKDLATAIFSKSATSGNHSEGSSLAFFLIKAGACFTFELAPTKEESWGPKVRQWLSRLLPSEAQVWANLQ